MDCLFCRIIRKEIPSEIVFENERVLAFRDIDPKAPAHILVVPKQHISGLDSITPQDAQVLGEIQLVIKMLAESQKINKSGYRVVINNGRDAGQAVAHIHYHLLGGRKFQWPPG